MNSLCYSNYSNLIIFLNPGIESLEVDLVSLRKEGGDVRVGQLPLPLCALPQTLSLLYVHPVVGYHAVQN